MTGADDYRSERALVADERTQLEAFVNDNRLEILALLDGLTDEQARRHLVPSLTTPASIVKHCVFVEKVWFHVTVAGMSREEAGIPYDADESWILDDTDTPESLRADYLAAVREAEQIASGLALDDLALHNRRGPLTLRWIYAHLVEELARHAGHGDILREQILAEV
jgi:hypothetical protein